MKTLKSLPTASTQFCTESRFHSFFGNLSAVFIDVCGIIFVFPTLKGAFSAN